MLASRRFLACYLALQSVVLGLASPLLVERNNWDHLKCTNAPSVVAGHYVDPNDAIPPSSASATCQAEYEYLYCVPGTKTYIFFGVMRPTLQSNLSEYAATLRSNNEYIQQQIEMSGDRVIDSGLVYLTTHPSTGVQVYIEDANKHHVTYGVAGAALTGLNDWMGAEVNGYSDATFQINDGPNWVGNGYIGALTADGSECVFESAFIPNTPCIAGDPNGDVWGYDGGKLC